MERKQSSKDFKKSVKPEPMTKETAEKKAAELAVDGAGRYVLAWAQEGGSRMFLKDLRKDSKDVLFETFCVTWEKVEASGPVIAMIDSFRVDKSNHVYVVVKPVLYLGIVEDLFTSGVWDFFLPYNLMWRPYGNRLSNRKGNFNVEAAYSKLGYDYSQDGAESRKKIFGDMLDKKFSFDALSKALNTPTKAQEEAEQLYKDWKDGKLAELTYLQERMNRTEMDKKQLVEFCTKEHESYVRLGLQGAANVAEEANAVIEHYAVLKLKEKEQRKANRKAAKEAKKSAAS